MNLTKLKIIIHCTDRRGLHARLRPLHDGTADPLAGRRPSHPRSGRVQDPFLRRHPVRVQRLPLARRQQPEGRLLVQGHRRAAALPVGLSLLRDPTGHQGCEKGRGVGKGVLPGIITLI